MAENMIRQIARTIRAEHEGPTGPNDDTALPLYEKTARAVLAVMREPTDHMVSDGAFQIFAGQQITETDMASARRVWRAMLSRASKEAEQ